MSVQNAAINGNPTVVSLFAGCGGSSLGYQLAGYKVMLAAEWDNNAVETYKLNFPNTPIYHGDIKKLSAKNCCKQGNIKPGEVDILDGSPPCQGFSTAGKRNLSDIRNTLFWECIRLTDGLSPRVVVFENVTGMVKGPMKPLYIEFIRAIRGCGYRVAGQVLNTKYYYVPQSRERVIIIGVRDDLNCNPIFPKPQSVPITVREAIGHLPVGVPGKHQKQVIEAWHKSKPGRSRRKACRYVGSFQSVRLDPNRPSYTQVKSHLHWHYNIPRKLTIKEAAILSGFPEDYKWAGTKPDKKERIGNSVPPLFMKAIAEHIRDKILKRGAA